MSNPFALAPGAIHEGFFAPENRSLLSGILRGIEKESLRVTETSQLAQTPHPSPLGSALTHPQITTDFSEALLEFITPPSHRVSMLLNQLRHIHQFTYQNLPPGELLWNNSMPCSMGQSDDVPVAQYGTTNRGKMKTVYRVGLGHRYGRIMQTVAGVHFNFSLPEALWAFIHQNESSPEELIQFKTRRYFDLIRNFRRHYWLLIYLFGASPVLSKSFVAGRPHKLLELEGCEDTLYLPYATSLRMGDLGYQSHAQESLYVCYNSRSTYVKTLSNAIATAYPEYDKIGVLNQIGEYQQLNTSLLQIENEFYSPIRPKRTAQKGETALTALCRRGVEYIEVRCLDIDPFSDIGISPEQIRFLDIFLVYCALQDSPLCDTTEFKRILENQKRVVTEGRRPGLELESPSGETIALQDWANQLVAALQPVADLLDHSHDTQAYQMALDNQKAKILNPDLTPSAKVLAQLKANNQSFIQWGMDQAEQQKARFLNTPLPPTIERKLQDMAEESLAIQSAEEELPQAPFAEYLEAYYLQYVACCPTGESELIRRAKELLLNQ